MLDSWRAFLNNGRKSRAFLCSPFLSVCRMPWHQSSFETFSCFFNTWWWLFDWRFTADLKLKAFKSLKLQKLEMVLDSPEWQSYRHLMAAEQWNEMVISAFQPSNVATTENTDTTQRKSYLEALSSGHVGVCLSSNHISNITSLNGISPVIVYHPRKNLQDEGLS